MLIIPSTTAACGEKEYTHTRQSPRLLKTNPDRDLLFTKLKREIE